MKEHLPVAVRTQVRRQEESWGGEQVNLNTTDEDSRRAYSQDSSALLEAKALVLQRKLAPKTKALGA